MRSFILALIIVLGIWGGAYAVENVRKVTVTGKSETIVQAHYAVIHIEAKRVQKEMSMSHSEVMRIISSMTRDLKNLGLKDADIRRSLVLQGPEYAWERNSRVLKGYYSECVLELTVNDINKISDVYRKLAEYKDISIEDTEFKRNDEFEIRQAEFKKALSMAEKKARAMAGTFGAKLGKVYSIQEISESGYNKAFYSNVISKGEIAGATEKANYGNIKISALVVVEFELQ